MKVVAESAGYIGGSLMMADQPIIRIERRVCQPSGAKEPNRSARRPPAVRAMPPYAPRGVRRNQARFGRGEAVGHQTVTLNDVYEAPAGRREYGIA